MTNTTHSAVTTSRALLGAALALAAGAASATAELPIRSRYNLAPPVTEVAADIYWLHWMMLGICGVIFVVVFAVMFYSVWKHRKSKGAVPAQFHENTQVEVVWTVIPFIIVIAMAIPATKTVVAMKDTSNSDITIKATGYQWQWGYDYLRGEGEGIGFLSRLSTPLAQIEGQQPKNVDYLLQVDNPLVVPVGKKIRLITTANDVIHAWWVPAFGVKQDAIPGFARDTWFKAEQIGTFRGMCAELCGKDHAFMPIVVNVVSAADYTQWVDGRKKAMAALADDPATTYTLEELMARGAKVYAANCQACHQATGKGMPPTFPPLDGAKIVQSPAADEIQVLLNGRNAMPAWKGVLNDTEIAAVITYTKHSWGNKVDQIVQPAEVRAARK